MCVHAGAVDDVLSQKQAYRPMFRKVHPPNHSSQFMISMDICQGTVHMYAVRTCRSDLRQVYPRMQNSGSVSITPATILAQVVHGLSCVCQARSSYLKLCSLCSAWETGTAHWGSSSPSAMLRVELMLVPWRGT